VVSFLDRIIEEVDQGLKVLSGAVLARRSLEVHASDANLTDEQKKISAKLMRVNHTGEVCAQALYLGQALVEKDLDIKTELNQSAKEELDHLVWTQQRVDELGGRTSLLNPVFYAGSFAIGVVAGLFGTQRSLGFLQETERQVEAHLTEHLDRVSSEDGRSRAMIVKMREEERSHANRAERLGAKPLPKPVRVIMRLMSKAMTQSTFRI
jgi:ubiquinone biosynthesis monooxygenase Coq7